MLHRLPDTPCPRARPIGIGTPDVDRHLDRALARVAG
jgi:hypothetical protein